MEEDQKPLLNVPLISTLKTKTETKDTPVNKMRLYHSNINFRTILLWILQILLWFLLYKVFFGKFKRFWRWGGFKRDFNLGHIFCIVIYLLYLILELSSETYLMLRQKALSIDELKAKLRKIFNGKVRINLSESFYLSAPGNKKKSLVFFSGESTLDPYSIRDVSGLLNLEELNDYPLMKLLVNKEVNFADSVSYFDYYKLLCKIHGKYENNGGSYFEFNEERRISFYEEFQNKIIMVKLNGSAFGRLFTNRFIFVLETLLTLAEPFKFFIDGYVLGKEYKIRKIISTRNDLFNDLTEKKYAKYKPAFYYDCYLDVVDEIGETRELKEEDLRQMEEEDISDSNILMERFSNSCGRYRIRPGSEKGMEQIGIVEAEIMEGETYEQAINLMTD